MSVEQSKQKFLGELLKDKGIITEEHIKYALQEQKITKEMMGQIFQRVGFVTEYEVVTTLAEQENVPYIDVDEVLPEEKLLKLFNKNLCINNLFLPTRVPVKWTPWPLGAGKSGAARPRPGSMTDLEYRIQKKK